MDRMQKDIKVSVITAVYNSEAYLPAMLDSVLAQSLKEIEIICVDDGSADRSLAILKEYAKKDQRIVVLQQKEKTDGAAAARNLGIGHANGQYLSILDSDDFFGNISSTEIPYDYCCYHISNTVWFSFI